MRYLPALTFERLFTALVSVPFLLSAHAQAGSECSPGWIPTFGGLPGTDGTVEAQVVFDDGSGPALYVAGGFSSAGGVHGSVARWNGTSLTGVGEILDYVTDLVVHDDGSGPALYASISNYTQGAGTTGGVVRWNGGSWSSLGNGPSFGGVSCLAVHDDGGGPALYAGGTFLQIGGVSASRVARWDGSTWSSVGGGADQWVSSLATYDDGTGVALYAAGRFTSTGSGPAGRIARWDGSSWSPLGSGLSGGPFGAGSNGDAEVLFVHDDGTGPVLLVGGSFTHAGGVPVEGVARWDGASWSAFGSGIDDVRTFAVFDDGTGPALYAGTDNQPDTFVRWNGSAWTIVGGAAGMRGDARSLAVFDAGAGARLYAGGLFRFGNILYGGNLASWDGSTWSRLTDGLNGPVQALTTFDDGSGPALYAGGTFRSAHGVPVDRIGRWDGSAWSSLGSMSGEVHALTTFDDGSGAVLIAAGSFNSAGGMAGSKIASWNGASWTSLDHGLGSGSRSVRALAVWDGGGGPALYAGGDFTSASSMPVNGIAAWDGTIWSALGSGMAEPVHALCVFDDGGGSALYAGGEFTAAGGVPANRIARWDGSAWSTLGSGVSTSASAVFAMIVFDDGSGEALYVGGSFSLAGGLPVSNVARWDGATWSAVGGGVDGFGILAFVAFDDGSGPALYAGGDFESGGGSERGIARWNGTSWSPVGSGTGGTGLQKAVLALAVHDDGSGSALYAGGTFTSAIDSSDSFLAKWGCAEPEPTAFCFGDAAVCPCGNGGAPGRGCDNAQGTGGVELTLVAQTTSPNGATVTGTGFVTTSTPAALVLRSSGLEPSPVVFGDGLRCVASTGLVRLGATQASGGTSTHAFGHGAMAGAGDFHYQLWYRNTPSAYCTPAAFNLSNGLRIGWP